MHWIETANLKLIFKCVFAVSFLLLAVEILRPGLIIDNFSLLSGSRRNSDFFSEEKSEKFRGKSEICGRKKILFWTEFFGQQFEVSSPVRLEAQAALDECSAKNCVLTNDKKFIDESFAVIFHIRDFSPKTPPPAKRWADQLYVFYLLESPLHTSAGISLDSMNEFFNLTFTYRLDSDIPSSSYFKNFSPSLWKNKDDLKKSWEKKTNFAAIFMSYCNGPSLRSYYINELAEYIPLDVFGDCGKKKCDKTNTTFCDEIVSTYKFYLAFENSVCKDYVTEKVYRALNQGSIPVVYGGANYTQFLPPNSFINILDFPSARKLADYLLFLAKNETEYSKYFDWRFDPNLTVLPERFRPENVSWCRLCKILNERGRSQEERIVKDLSFWWDKSAHCVAPPISSINGQRRWLKNPVVDFS